MAKERERILGLKDIDRSAVVEQPDPAEEPEVQPVAPKKKAEPVRKFNPKKGKSHKRGKKYLTVAKQLKKDDVYDVAEAVKKIRNLSYVNFTESVELHVNVDKQGLKGEVELPHSTGKTVRVKILDDETLNQISAGKLDFDVLVAHPSFMPKLAKFAKILGPKGLMPNPKAGTVSPNPEEVVKKFEKGTLQWRTEPKQAVIHQMVGKASDDDIALIENITTFLSSVGKSHIRSAFLKTTMSPSVQLDLSKLA
ncbi:MAG: hypothetical protein N2691_05545 [Patescibacteria group bacterium]|nr:hypothetical protein [Patescibacteria group bacterium]